MFRPLLLGLGAYAFVAVSYPDYTGQVYHVITLSVIVGGAVGLWFLGKILDLPAGAAKLGLELAFTVVVLGWTVYTMPQLSGKTPIEQWASGVKPNRAAAAKGLKRLGLDPDGLLSPVVKLFPR